MQLIFINLEQLKLYKETGYWIFSPGNYRYITFPDWKSICDIKNIIDSIQGVTFRLAIKNLKYNQLINYEISNHGLKSMEKRYIGKSFWSKNKIKNKRLFLDMTEKTSCGTCSSDFIKMKNSQENKYYSQTCI